MAYMIEVSTAVTDRRALSRYSIALLFILSACCYSTSHAESFTVRARILCPAYFQTQAATASGAPITVVDPYLRSSDTVPALAACANIRVEARDSDPGFDDYCGSGYTNLSGDAHFGANCGDGIGGGRPDVFLEVQVKSANGWEVATYDWKEAIAGTLAAVGTLGFLGDLADFATANDEYKLQGTQQKHPNSGDTLNYGGLSVGDTGDSIRSRAEFAGTVYFLSDVSVRALNAVGYNSPLLPSTKWVLDTPFGLGSPTTVWNEIMISESRRTAAFSDVRHTLRAVPHEFGHVFHNERHSGETHWYYLDAIHYLHAHNSCSNFSPMFGWYEGFANAVRNIAFDGQSSIANEMIAGKLQHKSRWNSRRIEESEAECNSKTSRVEGNVEAVLSDLYFGNYESRTGSQGSVFTSTRVESNLLTHRTQALGGCPSALTAMPTFNGAEVLGLVARARSAKANGTIADNHGFYDYWNALVRLNRCLGGTYCRSPTLRTRSARVLDPPIGFNSSVVCPPLGQLVTLSPVAAPATERNPPQPQIDLRNIPEVRIAPATIEAFKKHLRERKAAALRATPLKVDMRRRYPDIDPEIDWMEYGLDATHIAEVDFIGTPKDSPKGSAIAPHVTHAITTDLERKLKRAPTAAEVQQRVAEENSKIKRLNEVLAKDPAYLKARIAHDDAAADARERVLVANAMGYAKGDGDEARDDKPLSDADRKKLRNRVIATLINEQYAKPVQAPATKPGPRRPTQD